MKEQNKTNRIFMFLITGSTCFALCIAIQWTGIELLKTEKTLTIITSAVFANFTGWLLNRKLTFKSKNKIKNELLKYSALNITSSALATIVIHLLMLTGAHYITASLITAFIFFGINFIAHSRITFIEKKLQKRDHI